MVMTASQCILQCVVLAWVTTNAFMEARRSSSLLAVLFTVIVRNSLFLKEL